MSIQRVTQIAVLEEFNVFLSICDKSVVAYHLDQICPLPGASANDSVRRAPQKLSGSRDVGFFATGKMKDRTLVLYKKRDGLSSIFKVRTYKYNLIGLIPKAKLLGTRACLSEGK